MKILIYLLCMFLLTTPNFNLTMEQEDKKSSHLDQAHDPHEIFMNNLLQSGKPLQTVFEKCMIRGELHLLPYFLARGINVNVQNERGETFLHRIARLTGNFENNLQVQNKVLLINLLGQNGLDLSIKDVRKFTALEYATNRTIKAAIIDLQTSKAQLEESDEKSSKKRRLNEEK